VDLAPITDPDLVPVTVARTLGLPDQSGCSTMDTLLRFVRDRQMLVVLDNCEHLRDACAELVVALLGAASGLCAASVAKPSNRSGCACTASARRSLQAVCRATASDGIEVPQPGRGEREHLGMDAGFIHHREPVVVE
jgi:hypothetical protein